MENLVGKADGSGLETFEQSRARERAEKVARLESFDALMASVGVELAKLGDPAVFQLRRDADNDRLEAGRLEFADGLVLDVDLYKDGYHAGAKYRIRFSPNVPREHDGSYRSLRDYGLVARDSKSPEISVQFPEASPLRIAKDVIRRLLMMYDIRSKMAKVAEYQASRKAHHDGHMALARELFARAGQPLPKDLGQRDRYPSIRLYEYAPGVSYGDIQVRGDDSVHIEVNVNGAVAKEFLAMLSALRSKVS